MCLRYIHRYIDAGNRLGVCREFIEILDWSGTNSDKLSLPGLAHTHTRTHRVSSSFFSSSSHDEKFLFRLSIRKSHLETNIERFSNTFGSELWLLLLLPTRFVLTTWRRNIQYCASFFFCYCPALRSPRNSDGNGVTAIDFEIKRSLRRPYDG